MKTWKHWTFSPQTFSPRTFFGMVAILALTFALAACMGKGVGGGGSSEPGTLTITNLPSDISEMFVSIYDTSKKPATKSEYHSMTSGVDYAYDGKAGDGSFLGAHYTTEPPYSPAFLRSYRESAMASTFDENGSFFTIIGFYEQSKFAVIKYTKGSATVNWNTMADIMSLPE